MHIFLDSKLDFKFHVDQKIKNCNKSMGIISRLSVSVQKKALLTMCKSSIGHHLYHSYTLYDKPENENFQIRKKFNIKLGLLELVQYKEHQGENLQ